MLAKTSFSFDSFGSIREERNAGFKHATSIYDDI